MQKQFSPLLWVLVTVFFLRALLPTGFMPDMSGKHLLTICSGNGLATIAVDNNNQPLPQKPAHTNTETCPFSSLSSPLLADNLSGMVLLPAPLVLSEGMAVIFLGGILPLSLDGQHQSRAPPIPS